MTQPTLDHIRLTFNPNGLDYVRRVLGARPYDEVRPLIADIEQQIALQQLADPAKENGPEGPLPMIEKT